MSDTAHNRVFVGAVQKLLYAVAKGRSQANPQPSEKLVESGFERVAPGILTDASNDKMMKLIEGLMPKWLKYRTIWRDSQGMAIEISGDRGFHEDSLHNLCIAYLGLLSTKDGNTEDAGNEFRAVHLAQFDKVI
jgi:hypothetical protein